MIFFWIWFWGFIIILGILAAANGAADDDMMDWYAFGVALTWPLTLYVYLSYRLGQKADLYVKTKEAEKEHPMHVGGSD